MYAVNVRFFDPYSRDTLKGREYYYLTYEMLPVGATVVVDTRNGLSLAQVTSIPIEAPKNIPESALRSVVCIVPLTSWYMNESARLGIGITDK